MYAAVAAHQPAEHPPVVLVCLAGRRRERALRVDTRNERGDQDNNIIVCSRRARSRRRPAAPTRATGGCSPAGARARRAGARRRTGRGRGVPGRGGRPRVPARHGRPPRRGDRRRAPRAGPSEPVRLGRGPAVLSGIRRRHGTAPERRAAPLDLGPLEQVLAGSTRPPWPDCATRRCYCSGSPRRCAARSSSRSTSSTSRSRPPAGCW